MRRGSLTPLMSQGSVEPVIVVDEPGIIPEEIERQGGMSPQESMDIDSPTLNPYLLSPWRDPREVRKHSLPTPQCAGITASQVRRLSDRGGEGPSPREAAFLATLSQAPAPSPGGRRHSVVTISKVPSSLFGRSRRESVAAYPTGGAPGRILGSRRESMTGAVGPPSTEHRGSIHNLQLDIMDDIVTARKVRMKMWNTSNEKVCEVQPLDEAGVESGSSSAQRYTQPSASAVRRYSDFVGTPLPAIPAWGRRASEFPVPTKTVDDTVIKGTAEKSSTGIVCTNTDLICILSSNLTSSATEINHIPDSSDQNKSVTIEQKRNRLKNKRSNSFDVSILHRANPSTDQSSTSVQAKPANWFVKRHQPMSTKNETRDKVTKPVEAPTTITKEKPAAAPQTKDRKPSKNDKDVASKVVWDGRSGSLVDAEALGSAIEVFLRRSGTSDSSTGSICSGSSPSKGAIPKTTLTPKSSGKSRSGSSSSSGWYSTKENEDEATESCDTSLCSTLKDLFVK